MKREVKGRQISAKAPVVRFVARPGVAGVELAIERDSRREAKQDLRFQLSPGAARELMRALQGAADRADQLAYQAARAPAPDQPLDVVIEQLAAALELEPWCAAITRRGSEGNHAMTTLPRPTPSFTLAAAELVGEILRPVDPVIPSVGPDSFGRDAALPAGEPLAYSSSALPFAAMAAAWRARIQAEQLVDVQVTHYRSATRTAPNGFTLRPSRRRAHTLPRANQTEETRGQIARERMQADIRTASAASLRLCNDWRLALESFAGGHKLEAPTERETYAQVVVDVIEERTRGFRASDRIALLALLTDDRRLRALPFLSAAHIAGAWAVLASKQTDWNEADRMHAEAYRWVTDRF